MNKNANVIFFTSSFFILNLLDIRVHTSSLMTFRMTYKSITWDAERTKKGKMKKPELTIGISFYNTKDNIINLARCIYSQTFSDWELILADDGSTDGGADIARKIKDPRVKVVGDGINRGMAVRYNQITKMAQGEFIARFDADDLCDPRRFGKPKR